MGNQDRKLNLQEKKVLRTQIMKFAYESTNGDTFAFVDLNDAEFLADYGIEDVTREVKYLEGEYLVKALWTSGIHVPPFQLQHLGVLEVEQALENDNQATEHFVPLDSFNVNIFNGNVHTGAIIQGKDNVTNINEGIDFDQLKEILNRISTYAETSELKGSDSVLVDQAIENIRSEIDSPHPREKVIRASVRFLRELMIASGGSIAAAFAVQLLGFQ